MWRETLGQLIRDRGETMKSISLRAGLGETAVRDILQKRVNSPSIETLTAIADALEIPLSVVLGGSMYGSRTVRYIKVVGEVAAGAWRDVTHADFQEFEIPIPMDPKYPAGAMFALQIRGTSINRKAQDGDWVVCLKCESAPRPFQSGDWVVVEQTESGKVETTIKKVRWNRGWELWPDSTDTRWKTPIQLNGLGDGIEVRVTAFVLDFVAAATRF